MKIANLRVSGQMLSDLLRLPPGTEIVGCHPKSGIHSEIVLQITHDKLDDVQPGELIPDVDVVIYTPVTAFHKHPRDAK